MEGENKMKYGVIFFKNTANMGDDIQTYASFKLLPKVDYVIEREELSSFVPIKNELVTTIMNGWYVHDVTSLPPSPFINPLVISAHFTDHLLHEKPEYFDEYFLNFMRKVQPIGLRDDLVKKYLDDAGIKNYFSGCLTLTIKPFKNIKAENKICIVDVDDDIVEKIKKTAGCEVITETHTLNPEINSLLSFEDRMINVETKLKKYQSSKLVITSRLHVALPCLSIGVPVLLIYDDTNVDVQNRLGKYTELLNFVSKKQFLKKPCYDIENKKDFLRLRKSLLKKVNEFLENSKDKKLASNEDINYYNKYYVEQKKHIDIIVDYKNKKYEKRISEFEKNWLIDAKNINKLNMIIEFYSKESEIRAKKLVEYKGKAAFLNSQLESITSSKGYRLLEFIRKIFRKLKRMLKISR